MLVRNRNYSFVKLNIIEKKEKKVKFLTKDMVANMNTATSRLFITKPSPVEQFYVLIFFKLS